MAQILAYTTKRKEGQIEKISGLSAMQDNPREAALVGYLAGIFDGEGCIGIKKYKPRGKHRTMCYYLYLYVGMQAKEVVSLLHDVLGGNLKEERVLNRRSMWRWNVTGKLHIAAILNMLLPYLRVKKIQALLALECCSNWELQTVSAKTSDEELLKREDSYQMMKKLKHQKHPQRSNELALETVKR